MATSHRPAPSRALRPSASLAKAKAEERAQLRSMTPEARILLALTLGRRYGALAKRPRADG